jgi:outer membrane lipoprotein-sorting protein
MLLKMRVLSVVLVLLIIVATVASGQELLTATAFFDQVSDRYGGIADYSAQITITSEETISTGDLLYRKPNFIRIDFERPEDQILVSDGLVLQVYIPRYNVVLSQQLRAQSDETLAAIAGERGLALLRRNYSIAYLDSPDMVPLEDQSSEMVTKLLFNWRNTGEGYRQLTISIGEDMLIRRIIGVTMDYREVQFDFRNVEINPGIPASRFEYRGPASANTFYDFLFEGEG